MRKFFLGLVLVVLLLLSALFLAVNSPYVVDRIARKFAPEFHFRYDRIYGSPLKGIILDGLYYRDRKLARKIMVRINPYALLEKTLNVSKLHLYDVNVTVLETVIGDFTSPAGEEEEETEESGGGLPLGIELDNIHLSLLPFQRYGVKVSREELSVDTIYYDEGRFNVGNLKQIAETSLGTVELEGTYHKRFLDVEILAVEDLDLTQLMKLLKTLGAVGAEENATASSSSQREGGAEAGTEGEDLFLPRKIHAKKLWVTLKPYEVDRELHLAWAQLEGTELLIDLERNRIVDGDLTIDLDTNMGTARLQTLVEKEKVILKEGVVGSVDLERILAWSGVTEESNDTQQGGGAAPGKKAHSTPAGREEAPTPYDAIPFVPPLVDVEQLRIELKSGRFDGIDYRDPVLSVRNLHLDLHRNRLEAEGVETHVDTPFFSLSADTAIDGRAIRVRSLEVADLNVEKLTALGGGDGNGSIPKREGEAQAEESQKSSAKGGVTLPFVPSTVILESGRVVLRPFTLDPLQLRDASVSLESLRLDLTKLLLEEGRLKIAAHSNLADLDLHGRIRENRVLIDPKEGRQILLEKRLFETLGIPLRAEAFSPIRIEGSIDEKEADLSLLFSARKILEDQNTSFNVDINRSVTKVRFRFAEGEFTAEHRSEIAVPQAPHMRLEARLEQGKDGKLRYRGLLDGGSLKLGDAKVEKMLGRPRVDFEGDLASVKAKLVAGVFGGSFVSPDFKKGRLELGTVKPLVPARYVKLPEKLSKARVELKLATPIDFSRPLPLESNLTLRSNLANIDGTVRYDGNVSAKLTTRFPKGSLLAAFDPKLNLKAIDPLVLALRQVGERWKVILKSRQLKADIAYGPESEWIDGEIDLAGSRIKVSGQASRTITAVLKTSSVKKFISGITHIYKIETPKLDGDLALLLKIEKLSRATLELRSKQFVPDDTARIKSPIKNISLLLGADLKNQTLIVKKYHLETAGMKIFSNKPSRVKLQKDRLTLEAFWVNDSLKLQGYYDLKKSKGEVKGKAERFKVVHENAKLDAGIDLNAKIDGEKIDVKGKILIYGGDVNYDIEAKHYATDEDIVIVQHRKKDEESFFRKNVQLNLYIESKKPLLFKQKDVYVELRPQLSILKGFDADLQMMGSVSLAKGGYYTFQGKRFVLEPSSINFTGKPTQPLLDIDLVYRRYSRTVYISVSGLATEPNLNFSSDPYMSRDQILSFILFDTVDSGENAGNMLSMVGGGIAKSILGNIGLKVDTLVLTQEGFEVGKKITDKITVLYDQKEKDPKVIVRIQHSKRTETDISVGSESQSVDIIYKKEF